MDDSLIKLQELKINRQLLNKELEEEYNASNNNLFSYDVLVQSNLYTEYECGFINQFTKKAKLIRLLDEDIYKIKGENPFFLWSGPLIHIDHLVKTGQIKTKEQIDKTAKFAAYLEDQKQKCIRFNDQTIIKRNLSDNISEEEIDSKFISIRIKMGETVNNEFKSTLRWNIKKNIMDTNITHSCLKTISSFLNTKGGYLLIGIDDSKNVIGVERDKYKSYDEFENALYNNIRNSIGQEEATLVNAKIYKYKGTGVCLVKCNKSSKPVYLKYKNRDEEFFVRTGSSTTKLNISEVHSFISNNF